MVKTQSIKWTREHFLIALNLYCKLPFGKLHKGNPLIIDVAKKMGRTPSSLSMKLCNFASLDPVQQKRGIRGLSGATKQDRLMWNEFHANVSALAPESEQILHDLFTNDEAKEVDFLQHDKFSWNQLLNSSFLPVQRNHRQQSEFVEDSNSLGRLCLMPIMYTVASVASMFHAC